jgi:hypothetical protein
MFVLMDLTKLTINTGQDEASHVPTADRVERIFHGDLNPFREEDSSSSSSDDDDDEEEIEEIDFNELDQLLTSPKRDRGTGTTKRKVKVNNVLRMIEDQVATGFYQTPTGNRSPPRPERFEASAKRETEKAGTDKTTTIPQQPGDQLFIIDTEAGCVPASLIAPQPSAPSEDEEIIVYVAPHPKVHSQSSSQTRRDEHTSLTGSIPQPHGAFAFQPYNSPLTLSLASMSIDQHTAEVQQADEMSISPPSTAATPDPPIAEPASRTLTTLPPIPTLSSLKFNFSNKAADSLSSSGRKLPDIVSSRVAKKQKAWEKKKVRRERKKIKKGRHSQGSFAAYGALLSDARLYDDDDVLVNGVGKDSRWEDRRRGDSDIDWGTEESGDEKNDEEDLFIGRMSGKAKGKQKARADSAEAEDIETAHGMDVDLEMDVGAMRQFVSGLVGTNADHFTTMDDVEDERKIRDEDEEGLGGAEGSSDEDDEDEDIEAILDLEEKLLIGEEGDDDDDLDSNDEESDEDELDISPKTGFQARLERLRARARAKRPAGDAPDEDILERNLALAEEDDYDDYDDLVDHIQVGSLLLLLSGFD